MFVGSDYCYEIEICYYHLFCLFDIFVLFHILKDSSNLPTVVFQLGFFIIASRLVASLLLVAKYADA